MRKIRNSLALVLVAGSMLVGGAGTAAAENNDASAANVCHNTNTEGVLNILNNVNLNLAILGSVEDNDPCVSTAAVEDNDINAGKHKKDKKDGRDD